MNKDAIASTYSDNLDQRVDPKLATSSIEELPSTKSFPTTQQTPTIKCEPAEEISQSTTLVGNKSEVLSTPQKIDIYKPITLRPEVLKTEYFNDEAMSSLRTLSHHEPRKSVGYNLPTVKQEDSQVPDGAECEVDRASNYFNLLLSNLEFDENFCIIPPNKECDSSIENSVSKCLFAEEFSSAARSPCTTPTEEEEQRSLLKESIKKENGDFTITSTNTQLNTSIRDEESDNDIPVVTIDSDDELAIFVPEKKPKQRKGGELSPKSLGKDCQVEFGGNRTESGDCKEAVRTQVLSQNNYKNSKKRKFAFDVPCCGIYDQSFPHRDSCFVSPKRFKATICDNTLLEVSNIEEHLSVKSSAYNVLTNAFTMFHLHEKFGNLKMEPEFFDNYCSQEENVDLATILNANVSDGEETSHDVAKEHALFHSVNDDDDLFGFPEDSKSTKEKLDSKWKRRQNVDKGKRDEKKNNVTKREEFSRNLEMDSKRSFAFSGRSSLEFLKSYYKNKKGPQNRARLLRPNPTVPEVLQLLKESGWAVTPCNPIINYNVPPHATSPTIVPKPLEGKYGETGSDVVLWSLTEKEVSVPITASNVENNVPVGHSQPRPPASAPIRKTSTGNRLANRKKEAKKSTKKKEDVQPFKFTSGEKHIFPHSFRNLPSRNWREKEETKKRLAPIKMPQEGARDSNFSSLKTLRTADGAIYVRPSTSIVKKEPLTEVKQEMPDADDCIELPDDLMAYETALKGGFDVEAPPKLPENVFIPPPSPQKTRLKRTPHSWPCSSSQYPAAPSKRTDANQSRAERELSSIMAKSSPNDVPDFVCMTIQGKMYVYHRKN